jgi:hypothetical protein
MLTHKNGPEGVIGAGNTGTRRPVPLNQELTVKRQMR